jgi:SNF2 family DNA or RNA helicase
MRVCILNCRRLKGEVARQLAPKQQRLELVPLTPDQAALYADAVASLRSTAGAGMRMLQCAALQS